MNDKPFRFANQSVNALTWLACAVGFMMMLHVSTDVFFRTVLNDPLNGTIEIVSAYYMVGIAFLPLAAITRERGHIIVELFTSRMTASKRCLLDAVVGLISFVYVIIFTWQMAVAAIEKTEIREAWEAATGYVPVWPSRWMLPIGFGLMTAFLIYNAWHDFRAARHDKIPVGNKEIQPYE